MRAPRPDQIGTFSVKAEPAPAQTTRKLFHSRSLNQERIGKVAVILRRVSCGVKQIDTIPSGSVAEPRTLPCIEADLGYFSGDRTVALYNLFLLAHNHSFWRQGSEMRPLPIMRNAVSSEKSRGSGSRKSSSRSMNFAWRSNIFRNAFRKTANLSPTASQACATSP